MIPFGVSFTAIPILSSYGSVTILIVSILYSIFIPSAVHIASTYNDIDTHISSYKQVYVYACILSRISYVSCTIFTMGYISYIICAVINVNHILMMVCRRRISIHTIFVDAIICIVLLPISILYVYHDIHALYFISIVVVPVVASVKSIYDAHTIDSYLRRVDRDSMHHMYVVMCRSHIRTISHMCGVGVCGSYLVNRLRKRI